MESLRPFIWNICLMPLVVYLGVCLEKYMSDLLLLMHWPNHLQYMSRHSLMALASILVALEKSTMSSAYKTCVMAGPFKLALTPLIFLRWNSRSRSLDRTSWARMNMYDDSGSPYLTLLPGLNWSDFPPLIRTLNDTVVTQVIIQEVNVSLNPNLSNTSLRKLQFILS